MVKSLSADSLIASEDSNIPDFGRVLGARWWNRKGI